jgi:hypothetical protein
MGVLLALAVGYAIGAKAGAEGYEEVVQSLKAIRDSEEFTALLSALRSHASHVLKEVADVVATDGELPAVGDLVERVRAMARQIPT